MTTAEIRKNVIATKDSKWFQNVELDFNFNNIDLNFKLKGFTAIYEFVNNQLNGWKSLESRIPAQLNASKSYFERGQEVLISFLERYKNHSSSSLENQWRGEIVTFFNNNNNNTGKIFTYDSPATDFFINLSESLPAYLPSAFNFLITGDNININSKTVLIGANLASEFLLRDHSKVIERRNAEKASISKIRSNFQKYLTESEHQLVSHLKESTNTFENYIEEIDELKTKKEDIFDTWFNESKEKNSALVEETKNHRADLENTYRELLRLKEPATYWGDRAKELKGQGWKSTYWLIGLVAVAALSLFLLLWLAPDGMLLCFINDPAIAIKWSIIFVAFLSFLAYGIRTLAKISFSAFHLARDAEEREQLTYLYLSLRKDGNVDEKDRQFVLQALFSRAETGLLKDDSSPTMPGTGGIIDTIVKKN